MYDLYFRRVWARYPADPKHRFTVGLVISGSAVWIVTFLIIDPLAQISKDPEEIKHLYN